MKPREGIYQYTDKIINLTFFATEENAREILAKLDAIPGCWKKEYIGEVWQITGEI